jgi:tyrosinase
MYAHEHQLRSECDYEGDLPYWDETLDSTVSNATILDSVYGFGGDGHGDTYCITDGPFANYTNALGPGFIIGDHCIQRQITNWGIHSSSQERVDECMAMTNFTAFWKCAESGPHGGGHIAIGAQVRLLHMHPAQGCHD